MERIRNRGTDRAERAQHILHEVTIQAGTQRPHVRVIRLHTQSREQPTNRVIIPAHLAAATRIRSPPPARLTHSREALRPVRLHRAGQAAAIAPHHRAATGHPVHRDHPDPVTDLRLRRDLQGL